MHSIISYGSHYTGQSLKLRPTIRSLSVIDEFLQRFCVSSHTTREDIILIETIPHRSEDIQLITKCKSEFGTEYSRNNFVTGEIEYYRNIWNVFEKNFERVYLFDFISTNQVKQENGGPLQYAAEKEFFWKNKDSEKLSEWSEKHQKSDLVEPNKLEVLISKHTCYANFQLNFVVETEEEIDVFKSAIQFLSDQLKTEFKERNIQMMILNKLKTDFKRKPFRF